MIFEPHDQKSSHMCDLLVANFEPCKGNSSHLSTMITSSHALYKAQLTATSWPMYNPQNDRQEYSNYEEVNEGRKLQAAMHPPLLKGIQCIRNFHPFFNKMKLLSSSFLLLLLLQLLLLLLGHAYVYGTKVFFVLIILKYSTPLSLPQCDNFLWLNIIASCMYLSILFLCSFPQWCKEKAVPDCGPTCRLS